MSLLKRMGQQDIEETRYRPYINTGSPLDIINGKFIPTVDGGWALSGGLGLTTAVIAEANRYKSTLLNGCAVNALARFPESDFMLMDSEFSQQKERIAHFSDLYLDNTEERAKHIAYLKDHISIFDPTTSKAESLDAWFDYTKEIRDWKLQHYKDYEVETEILDTDTGKPYRMLLPTFMGVDSWTEAFVKQINVRNEEFDANTEMKDQRTMFLEEGWQKMRLMRELPSICAKGGIYFVLTGHLGEKQTIGNTPNKKDLAFMGQNETTKSMGSKFYFLMSSIFKIGNSELLRDKTDKQASEYPSESGVSFNELQRLLITYVRGKNAGDGKQVQVVSSQNLGVLNGLSYYDFLRENKYWGLGAPNKVRNPLLGDLNLGRTKIFDASKEYKVKRALELTYQLFVIQSYWSLSNQPVNYGISIEEFFHKLQGSGYAIDDILNSRGWWTYKQKDAKGDFTRPFLTLPSILAMLDGSYKSKYILVK